MQVGQQLDQTLERVDKAASDPRLFGPFGIYWLAFLLTGDRARSLEVSSEALASPDDRSPFFATWMHAWSRRVVIAKALAAMRDELAASARRTLSARLDKAALPARNWALAQGTTKLQLEAALLTIDVFSRCALLLSLFEGASLEDVAILLDSELALVRKAQAIGLHELTRNLARLQGWKSNTGNSFVTNSEVQHA
jgi:DNA-directed RNA polymerase specialized sigma24 family protein